MEFFAIVVGNNEAEVVYIPVAKKIQDELTGVFEQQAEEFLDDDLERIPFTSTYGVETTEIFRIHPYNIPVAIQTAIRSPTQLDTLEIGGDDAHIIKGIMAAEVKRGKSSVFIQSFNKVRLLDRRFTLLHSKDTFTKLESPGLTLDTKISAALVDGSLLFRTFATVSQFLNLYTYFHDATDPEIEEVISSPLFEVDDQAALMEICDQPMRKRFSAIKASGILDTLDMPKCKTAARKVGLTLTLVDKGSKKERIGFPTEKREIKDLLTFLTEGIYQGVLTGQTFKSNSHRPMNSPNGNGKPRRRTRQRN